MTVTVINGGVVTRLFTVLHVGLQHKVMWDLDDDNVCSGSLSLWLVMTNTILLVINKVRLYLITRDQRQEYRKRLYTLNVKERHFTCTCNAMPSHSHS